MNKKKIGIIIGIILFMIIIMTHKVNKIEHFEDNMILGIMASVKNEGIVIREWIEHYKWQGVTEFFLIDNGSDDNTKEEIMKYKDVDGIHVHYFFMPEKYTQYKNYNIVFNEYAKHSCEWLIICDADEYIYNKNRGDTIYSFLESQPNNVNSVMLQWKMFGSSEHEKQPDNIRKNFLWRQKDYNQHTKEIVRTKMTTECNIHSHSHSEGDTLYFPEELQLNHYAIMSKEYFEKVKMSRGDATTEGADNVRDWNYFKKYDHHDVEDTELSNLLS